MNIYEYDNALYDLYRDSWFDVSRTGEKIAIEGEAFLAAVEDLEPEDREYIEQQVIRLTGETTKIRQFGEKSAREVLAKVGIFLFANQRFMRRM